MTSKNNVQPSFLLKNINYGDIYKKYKSGYFNKSLVDISNKANIKCSKVVVPISKPSDGFKLVELSGQQYVKMYNANLQGGNITGGRCLFCHKDFTTEVIGYPLAYEEKQILNSLNQYEIYHIFWTEGCFHSDECCLAYIELTNNNFAHYNKTIDVKVLFLYMHRLLYNKEPLICNSPLLLDIYGGSMTFEQWSNHEIYYTRSSNVIKIPAQVPYYKKEM
jgi:hypothetical protein